MRARTATAAKRPSCAGGTRDFVAPPVERVWYARVAEGTDASIFGEELSVAPFGILRSA
jgi:hypothetical protein